MEHHRNQTRYYPSHVYHPYRRDQISLTGENRNKSRDRRDKDRRIRNKRSRDRRNRNRRSRDESRDRYRKKICRSSSYSSSSSSNSYCRSNRSSSHSETSVSSRYRRHQREHDNRLLKETVPKWDDDERHLKIFLGEDLTPRYKILSIMGEGKWN
jgi:hypothetical protein